MNWYSQLDTRSQGSGANVPLPEGAYTHNPKARKKVGSSLYIIKLLAPKEIKGGATRHTFLVGSDDENGTAFLKIDLKDLWLRPEAIAMAFRKKDETAIDPAVLANLDADMLQATEAQIRKEATDAVIAANTPPEAEADAVEKAIHSTLASIQINVGTIFRLCDWAGKDRNPHIDLSELENTGFEGAVKYNTFGGNISPEVSVNSKPVNGAAAPASKSTEFDPAKMA